MQSLTSCECLMCCVCFKRHFTVIVREKHIKDLVCPTCRKPEIDQETELINYFSTLDIQLRDCLEADVYNLFHKKLTERTLMKDPKFKWCNNCSNGFIYDGNELRVTCPQCLHSFCFKCNRTWETQHQTLSCEQFQDWKRLNDPEYQAQGLAAYLQDNGIDCPHCLYRYALAKGGCMHFTCYFCRHEFCSGCYNPFYNPKKACPELNCRLMNALHAHHPRDCLFYLRDWDVERLQSLLKNNKVDFNTEPPTGAQNVAGGQCQVMEQKDSQGNSELPCLKDVPIGHAGLCVPHYKEYLVMLINRGSVDPGGEFDADELRVCLERSGVCLPHTPPHTDAGESHRKALQILATIPLGINIPRVKK